MQSITGQGVEEISFKSQILHRITQQLTSGAYDEELLALFWLGDRLVEIQYDLDQYADDVARNVFNIYRMFLKFYGDEGRTRLERYMDGLRRDAHERSLRVSALLRRQLQASSLAFRADVPFPTWPTPVESDYRSGPRSS